MSPPMEFAGRTAVVTGAGGGIGRALALGLAAKGAALALVDIDPAGLAKTAQLTQVGAQRLTLHPLDLTDRVAIERLPADVVGRHGGVDLLINNAGVAVGGAFEEISDEDFAWLFQVNFFGTVRMTRAFLPALKAAPRGHLINVASIFGLIAAPGHTAYAASKFAVRGLSLALRAELAATSSVRVTDVYPGGVATAIAERARVPAGVPPEEVERRRREFARSLRMSPEDAAAEILRGIARGKKRVLVGTTTRIASVVERLAPVSHGRLLGLEKKRY